MKTKSKITFGNYLRLKYLEFSAKAVIKTVKSILKHF